MIDETVLSMFRRSEWNEHGLILPQMDRKLYDKCKKVLERMGFKWVRKYQSHVMEGDMDGAAALAELLETGKAPDGNPLAFWPTSEVVVEQMVDEALTFGAAFGRVLEPSAGDGRIAGLVHPRVHEKLVMVEVEPKRAAALWKLDVGYVYGEDFLRVDPIARGWVGHFDTVLMNPPFAVTGAPNAYVDHVLHAWRMVCDGGVLVSVAPAGLKFREGGPIAALREMVEANGRIVDVGSGKDVGMGTGTFMVLATMKKGG